MYKIKQAVGAVVYTSAMLAVSKQTVVADPNNEGFFVLEDARTHTEVLEAELTKAKAVKAAAIKLEFLLLTVAPVATADGLLWSGGWDSATKLDAAQRLAEAAGGTTVTLYTDNNIGHTLTLPEALVVVLTVAGHYQALLAKKQAFYLSIAEALTEAEVAAVDIDWTTNV